MEGKKNLVILIFKGEESGKRKLGRRKRKKSKKKLGNSKDFLLSPFFQRKRKKILNDFCDRGDFSWFLLAYTGKSGVTFQLRFLPSKGKHPPFPLISNWPSLTAFLASTAASLK